MCPQFSLLPSISLFVSPIVRSSTHYICIFFSFAKRNWMTSLDMEQTLEVAKKNWFPSTGWLRKTLSVFHERGLQIPVEIHNLFKGRNTFSNSLSAYDWLKDLRKAIKKHKRDFKIKIDIGDRTEVGGADGILGNNIRLTGRLPEKHSGSWKEF